VTCDRQRATCAVLRQQGIRHLQRPYAQGQTWRRVRCPHSMMLMSSCLIVVIRSNTYRPRVVTRSCAALTKTCCAATCRSGSSRTMLLWCVREPMLLWCVRERDAVQRDANAVLILLCLFPSLDTHNISISSVTCRCSHAFLP